MITFNRCHYSATDLRGLSPVFFLLFLVSTQLFRVFALRQAQGPAYPELVEGRSHFCKNLTINRLTAFSLTTLSSHVIFLYLNLSAFICVNLWLSSYNIFLPFRTTSSTQAPPFRARLQIPALDAGRFLLQ